MASVNPSLADQGHGDTTPDHVMPCSMPSPDTWDADTGMPTLGCRHWDADTGMPRLGWMLGCKSTGRMGRLRCLEGSRADTGMPWLGGMLSCESTGRMGRLRCLDGSRATLGHRRQGSSSGNLPPAYALGSRTPGCQCQTVVWLKGEDTWGGGYRRGRSGDLTRRSTGLRARGG